MVYDEGFDIRFHNLTFFTFSKYTIETKLEKNQYVYKSYCHATTVGWYLNNDKSHRGCFKAERLDAEVNSVSYYKTKKINETMENTNDIFLDIDSNLRNRVIEPMRFKEKAGEIENIKEIESYRYLKDLNHVNKRDFVKMWKKYLNNLRKIKKSWEVGYYSKFMRMSLKELNKFSGILTKNENKISFTKSSSNKKFSNFTDFRFRFKEQQLPSVLK
jgi:Xaa-Pro aminopeptidase